MFIEKRSIKMNSCCKYNNPLIDGEKWNALHKKCFMEWFSLLKLSGFSDIIPKSQSSNPLDSQGKNTSFFHGAFRKYSSRLGEINYILKVVQEDLSLSSVSYRGTSVITESVAR